MLSPCLSKFSVSSVQWLDLCWHQCSHNQSASMFPQSVRSLVVFGTHSYITEEEVEVYERIRDVGVWDTKVRGPLEEIYL